ncbi:MAG: tetratricopeptide repeat protein [Casimicrobium sp.]|jgi:TolB-like protein/Flp pilus assembly protein TadD
MDPSESLIAAELAHALESRTFARSARARDLLRYLIDSKRSGRSGRLKESAIALDVFSRDAATYDSATDGIVRVSVNRLRDLLDRYYADEGRNSGLRFEIQRGGYTPILRRSTPPGLPDLPRIAVLPLANFTGDTNNDALCDGLTEDIIDAMTRVPEVRVIARTSSFRYKGMALDVRSIATDLSVDALLEGSVQIVGDRLRITAQLILGSDATHLWSHAFTFASSERRELQDALIDIMLRSLKPGVPVLAAAPASMPSISPQAQSLIDQARGLNVTQAPDNLPYAETLAQRATELAPTHADAWFVLAMVRYSRRSAFADAAAHLGVGSVAEALRRALVLDPDNAQALSLSAYLLINDSLQWTEALQCAQRAVSLAPNHAGVNGRLAFIQLCFGNFSGSVQTYAHVFSLDPIAPPARYYYAMALATAGRTDEALHCIEEGRRVLGESSLLQEMLCSILEIAGDIKAAASVSQKALTQYPGSISIMMHAAYALAAQGALDDARALCARYAESANAAPDSRHYIRMYVESGGPDIDAFFLHAMAVASHHEPQVMLLPAWPIFNKYHRDARWQVLLQQLKFPKR